MSLYQQIRQDQVAARLLSRTEDTRLKARLLTTLLGESARVGKDAGDREPTDEEVVILIRKFIKNIDETLRHRPNDEAAFAERDLLSAYLPAPLSDDALCAILRTKYQREDLTVKNMKTILTDFEASHPGQVTGQQLAVILKSGKWDNGASENPDEA